jgi:MFS family permease
MTIASPAAFAASGPPIPAAPLMDVTTDYRPGVCNIGPAEIARRRRSGHVGVITAVILFGVLVAIDAPPLARFLVAAPAIIAASGYLQAWLKFCAGFGSAGVFNFGDVGATEAVADAAAKRADRRRALQIGAASFAIGIAVGIVAVLLPV